MQLGIMSGAIPRGSLEARLDAVREYGFSCMQFTLSDAGLPGLPDQIDASTCDRIREAFESRQLTMAAVSGTYNMIHPDPSVREDGLRGLQALSAAAGRLGTRVVTLCTGTRDRESMWRRHPDNDSPEAWRDLLREMEKAIRRTEGSGVFLAVEPEVSNVVDSARKARALLDAIDSPRLKICMDCANIFHDGELARMHEILDQAFDLLGSDIILAHAKDLDQDGDAGRLAAGTGLLDYPYYLSRLRKCGYTGALILHSLAESQVGESFVFVSALLHAAGSG